MISVSQPMQPFNTLTRWAGTSLYCFARFSTCSGFMAALLRVSGGSWNPFFLALDFAVAVPPQCL